MMVAELEAELACDGNVKIIEERKYKRLGTRRGIPI